MGVEPSEWAANFARENQLPILNGTLHNPELEDESFDVITMFDVIEHLGDPLGELRQAYTKLKPGGTIAVHTMDVDSLISRLMGKRWPWYMAMHVQYFSQATMAQFLEKAGFEVIWTGTQGRYLRLHYLAGRLHGIHSLLGRLADFTVNTLNLGDRAVPINFGDLFTVYARRVD